MSGTINATATVTDVQSSPGVFNYTVTMNDTGTTTIGTFWFGWIPGQDYMSAQPTAIGAPAGWSDTVTTNAYPGGTGYAIEFTANSSASYVQPGGSTSAFTFTSTETPAQLAANSPFATSTPTTTTFVYEGPALVGPGQQIVASVSTATTPSTGLIGSLSTDQQLELIYLAYFNRAGDGPGFTYWAGQNVQAQDAGQSASTALNNIANAFTPQAETIALYPFLGTTNLDLGSPAGQTGLTTFISSLYENMFGHAPDAPGAAYWLGQLTSGAVALGAAALAIANGATGADAIEVQNKVNVGVDFSLRTNLVGLGAASAPLPASFTAAAKGALSGVDGTSLNDASVTAGISATTTYISGATGANTVNLSGTNNTINVGTGAEVIQFLPGASADTVVLGSGGLAMMSGFAAGSDVLDFSALLSAANVNLNGSFTTLGNYVTIADQGPDAFVIFDPAGHGGGNVVAALEGSGNTVTSLSTLVAQGSVRIT